MSRTRPLTEAQQTLAGRYIPLARSLARPFKEQLPDSWEEFESAALMGLVESARTYSPDRGVKFATYARHRIRGRLRETRAERLRRNRAEPSCENDADTRDDCLCWSVLAATPDHRASAIDHDEAIDAVEDHLRHLPPQHAEALRLIFIGGLNGAETAREMGLSPSRIARLKRDGLSMLAGTGGGRRSDFHRAGRDPHLAALASSNPTAPRPSPLPESAELVSAATRP